MNRIAGPFLHRPPGLVVSPLGAVPKRDSEKIRIIHNLSFPPRQSVNYFIPPKFCEVEYQLIDKCIEIVSSIGEGCLMSKGDWSCAYRQIRIRLQDLHFLLVRGDVMVDIHRQSIITFTRDCPLFPSYSLKLTTEASTYSWIDGSLMDKLIEVISY